MSQQWETKINITDNKSQEVAKSIRTTRELLAAYALGIAPYPYPKETWRERLALAWRVLRGQITWRDIG